MVDGRRVARRLESHRLNERRTWHGRLENRYLAKINLRDVARTTAGNLLSATILNIRVRRVSMVSMMLCHVRLAASLMVHRAIWRRNTAMRMTALDAHANRGEGRDGDLQHQRDYCSRADRAAADPHQRICGSS